MREEEVIEKKIQKEGKVRKVGRILGKVGRFVRGVWRWVSTGLGGLLLIFFLFSFFGGLFTPLGRGIGEEYVFGEGEDKIALVPLSGLIFQEAEPLGPFSATRFITPANVRGYLQKAKSDPRVKGVILQINSPGGSAVASAEIWEEIRNFEKPVVVLLGDTAASGGYFIASAGDAIVASPSTLTGSIGVLVEIYNLSDLYKKLGVKLEIYKKGKFKDLLSEARERTEEEKEMLDRLLSDAYEVFLEKVAEGRRMGKEEVARIAEGRIYSGKEAYRLGLVDRLGGLKEAVELIKELAEIDQAKVFSYSRVGVWERLFGGMHLFSWLFPRKIGGYLRVMYLLEIGY